MITAMNTVVFDGITISIGATIVRVTYRPAKKKGVMTRTIREFWRNNYFRRNTKTYLGVKVAEVVSRCIGIHSVYLLAREYLWPHVMTIFTYIQTVNIPELLYCMDVGFIFGMLTASAINVIKRSLSEWIHERGVKA